jgi:hydroxypyruvate isomerase
MDPDQTASLAAEMGLVGMDLVRRQDWPVVKKHGLVATMVSGSGSIKKGLNDKSMHPKFLEDFRTNIKAAADYKWPNVITMAGDRKGIGDEEGMDNCHTILKEAVKIAEDYDVTICMELLNSRVNHPGYMCDKSAWGFELCRRVNSPRFKMLYDIYHMQIMEGDLSYEGDCRGWIYGLCGPRVYPRARPGRVARTSDKNLRCISQNRDRPATETDQRSSRRPEIHLE